MTASAALILAQANKRFRSGRTDIHLSLSLTPAQSGCALWLKEQGAIEVLGEAKKSLIQAERNINAVFKPGTKSSKLLASRLSHELLEDVAAPWFSHEGLRETHEVAAGYWLASIFHRRIDHNEASALTDFLIGNSSQSRKRGIPSVRRYPTGGISEKQALILPPLLLCLANEFNWCSPFLVAKKLAHTGGTRDKLAILPGFSITDIALYRNWNQQKNPVRYFAAYEEFCSRDAQMYRIRGETGTVADIGLIAASIMSKQTSLPADSVIIDTLYGRAAFLETREDAEAFGELCSKIGSSRGLKVTPMYRRTDGFLGNSIGSSTEVVEAAETLKRGDSSSELETAKYFIHQFAVDLNLDAGKVSHRIDEVLQNGDAFRAMMDLWAAHGVDRDFIRKAEANTREALLGGLYCQELHAKSSGKVYWDPIVTADIVNQKINCNTANRDQSHVAVKGGVEIYVAEGGSIATGGVIARIYAEEALSPSLLQSAFDIK
tara:strand:- start:4510 stop:5982 length:1473 start_codon:yes stop_codon:yes gene_type:complete